MSVWLEVRELSRAAEAGGPRTGVCGVVPGARLPGTVRDCACCPGLVTRMTVYGKP